MQLVGDKELHRSISQVNMLKITGKKVFLTGGTGFFGRWLLHSFLYANRVFKLNATVTVLSRSPQKLLFECPYISKAHEVNFLNGDIRDFTFPAAHYDFLIHVATPTDAKLEAENQQELYSIIVDGTKHIIDFAKHSGVQKILLTSSGAVYGVQPHDLPNINENFPTNPVTIYGKGKLEAEHICLNSGIDSVIARCFAFAGAYLPLNAHYAIGNFIDDILHKRAIIINGDGRAYRSYMYAADLAAWLWTILLGGVSSNIYNVGSEQAVSIEELARAVSNTTSPAIPYRILGTPIPGTQAPRYVPCTAKAQKELGLMENYSLEDSIKLMLKANMR